MKPGRESALDASIASPLPQRPDPPTYLSEAAKSEWRAIVNRLPADYFHREQFASLEALCNHTAREREYTDMIAKVDRQKDSAVRELDMLCKMAERESRAALAHARSLRLTLLAQYDTQKAARKANKGTTGGAVWQV